MGLFNVLKRWTSSRTRDLDDWLLILFGTHELVFAQLPHLIVFDANQAILAQWATLASAPLGIWGIRALYSSNAIEEPDYEAPPLSQWASKRNQEVLFNTIATSFSDAGEAIIDCRLDENLVRAHLGDKLATLELRDQWRKLTEFVTASSSWAIVPLIHAEFFLLIASTEWRNAICDMALWCEHESIELKTILIQGGRPELRAHNAADAKG
jgi:hypothetical protein